MRATNAKPVEKDAAVLLWVRRKNGGQAMRMTYIAHPFGGEQENIDKVQEIIIDFVSQISDHTFYSPLHATGFLYNDVDYIDGMEHCFEALSL